jgi:RNA-directed DNA polymerase
VGITSRKGELDCRRRHSKLFRNRKSGIARSLLGTPARRQTHHSLIQKWLRAGILEDGIATADDRGTGQGSVISPLLANIYLHYCFDLWAARWRRRDAAGDQIVVRYADDLVVGLEKRDDARRFPDAMRMRFETFALRLHPEKTRLIEFGRLAAANRENLGLGKPETFNFLGFTFICGKSRKGKFLVHRKTRRDRVRAKLEEVKEQLQRRRHQPIPEPTSPTATGP